MACGRAAEVAGGWLMIIISNRTNLRQQEALILMMQKMLADPTHSVTLTFNRIRMPSDKEEKLLVAEGAVRLFLRILNDRCFGRRYRRGEVRIGCVVVLEGMRNGNRLHLHLALRCESHITNKKFSEFIRLSARKVRDLGGIDIKSYYTGWYPYITKEPEAEVLWELCCG